MQGGTHPSASASFGLRVPGICGRITPCEHSAVGTEVIDPWHVFRPLPRHACLAVWLHPSNLLSVCTSRSVCKKAWVCIYVYIYIYIYTHIHAYIHTYLLHTERLVQTLRRLGRCSQTASHVCLGTRQKKDVQTGSMTSVPTALCSHGVTLPQIPGTQKSKR